jgi:hypothetical protein
VRFSYIFGVLGWATALSAVLVAQRGSAPEEPAIAAVSGQRDSNSANPTANGIIVGAVVNERDEPVANARVHAFPAHAPMSNPQSDPIVPRSMRASGSAATDSSGRFQISNLELGDYLVLVEPVPFVPSAGSIRNAGIRAAVCGNDDPHHPCASSGCPRVRVGGEFVRTTNPRQARDPVPPNWRFRRKPQGRSDGRKRTV